mmetsp:Transcript_35607/g.44074  ORF Transcript_35607/g.44074 Transcript_35607/m.44074 type:complete len:120 (-) Transcript_35607:1660-2019(-)
MGTSHFWNQTPTSIQNRVSTHLLYVDYNCIVVRYNINFIYDDFACFFKAGFPAAGLLMRWHQVQVEAKIFTRVKAPKIVANKFSQPGVNSISITPYQLCTSRMPSQQRMRKLWKFKVTK